MNEYNNGEHEAFRKLVSCKPTSLSLNKKNENNEMPVLGVLLWQGDGQQYLYTDIIETSYIKNKVIIQVLVK